MFCVISLRIFLLITCFSGFFTLCYGNVWAWRCIGSNENIFECIKERASTEGANTGQISLSKCKLTCGKYGSLLPKPNHAILGHDTALFLPFGLSLRSVNCVKNVCSLLGEATYIMNETINKYHPKYDDAGAFWFGPWDDKVLNHKLVVEIHVNGTEEYLTLGTDESYKLTVETVNDVTKVILKASTFFGARHGLETLSQLIDYDENKNSLQIVSSATIEDSPAFPYRGFIIDTSRNFISVKKIKKTLDAMAYNKLNSFHWHITDTHSFPLIINSLPNMAFFGAYSKHEMYSPSDVRELVLYARVRGIRLLPEIDAPAHVGHGWQWGEEAGLGKLAVCLDKKPWTAYCVEPPCGQMNLANEKLYDVLGALYNEVVDMFSPVDLFHFGGDEVNLNCWNTSVEITDWMKANGFGLDNEAYYRQWGIFQEKAQNLLTAANKGKQVPGIMWTSKLTQKGVVDRYLNKNEYIIQIWTKGRDPIVKELLEKGYNVIFSNYDALYLDCGVSSWVGKGTNWCSPYKGWQDIYDNDIQGMAREVTGSDRYFNQILGGEAALWTEQADDSTLESKLWPRGSALAERLWSNPSSDYRAAEHRMLQHRERLHVRGVEAARLQPEWCRQNQGQCKHVPPTTSP